MAHNTNGKLQAEGTTNKNLMVTIVDCVAYKQ